MKRLFIPPKYARTLHSDAGNEVLHIIEGNMVLRLQSGEEYPAGKNDTLFIPHDVMHKDIFEAHTGLEMFHINSYLLERFRSWAEEHGVKETIADDYSFDFQGREPDELILRFYHDMQKEYYDDMDAFLRSIGVKIPLCGNSWTKGLTLVSSMQDMDYTSANVYWDLWSDRGSNKDITKERMQTFGMIPSKVRIKGKPLYITEYDMVWPNEWRAVSPLMVASLGAFQSWISI